ncbi:hypothetical protein VP01_2605g3 [Puccinia sorghi]|uniref:HTH psq-type domain-containing protein n=1 Tax=Puccinia sorghi TaxID=27349 RepID=A0A0L6V4M5_9BASI|nr:hypothetical protein VP01_2605g3 [Puccinia sorghi]
MAEAPKLPQGKTPFAAEIHSGFSSLQVHQDQQTAATPLARRHYHLPTLEKKMTYQSLMARRKRKHHFLTKEKAVVVRMVASELTVLQVTRLSKLPRLTIHSILQQRQAQGTIEMAKQSDRPRKTSNQDLREIGRHLKTPLGIRKHEVWQ